MSNRHRRTKTGEPPCECPKCEEEALCLGGLLPFVPVDLLNLPEKTKRRKPKKVA